MKPNLKIWMPVQWLENLGPHEILCTMYNVHVVIFATPSEVEKFLYNFDIFLILPTKRTTMTSSLTAQRINDAPYHGPACGAYWNACILAGCVTAFPPFILCYISLLFGTPSSTQDASHSAATWRWIGIIFICLGIAVCALASKAFYIFLGVVFIVLGIFAFRLAKKKIWQGKCVSAGVDPDMAKELIRKEKGAQELPTTIPQNAMPQISMPIQHFPPPPQQHQMIYQQAPTEHAPMEKLKLEIELEM